jgi:lysyl-tRNA synthetase class 2
LVAIDPVPTQPDGGDDLVSQRLRKLNELRARGIEPYPTTFGRTIVNSEAVERFDELVDTDVSVAGRIMSRRIMGRASFSHIADVSGSVQLFLKEDILGPEAYATYRDLYDVGDFVGATGHVMKTRAGEVSIEVKSITLLAKSLRSLPEKWHGLTDVEKRYRQRYLDLIANPRVRRTFQIRSATLSAMRSFLEDRGFIEIETPVLQPMYGGAMARPFTTYHNELERGLYLRIATELYLKRAIVGGLDKVFEIGRVFRNEGIDTTHAPEFTVLESYEAYTNYLDVMAMLEEMIPAVARRVLGTASVTYDGTVIDFQPPWRRITLRDAIFERTGIDVAATTARDDLLRQAVAVGVPLAPDASRGKIIDELLSVKVEPTLIQPTFIVDYPVELSPLAKRKPDDPRFVERFEAYAAGFEFANAFSELNDSVEQRARFLDQVQAKAGGDDEAHLLDEEFIEAMEHGMPPTGGLGVGVDRIVMLLTDQQSIREVILFPLLRGTGPSG